MTEQVLPAPGEPLFQCQCFHCGRPGDGFHQKRLTFRIGFKFGFDPFTVNGGGDEVQQHHEGNQGYGHQAELGAVPEHGDDEDETKGGINDQYQGRTADKGTDGFQFFHAGYGFTDPAAFKVAQGQGDDVVIQAGAQYHVYFICKHSKNISTKIAQHHLEYSDDNQTDH